MTVYQKRDGGEARVHVCVFLAHNTTREQWRDRARVCVCVSARRAIVGVIARVARILRRTHVSSFRRHVRRCHRPSYMESRARDRYTRARVSV